MSDRTARDAAIVAALTAGYLLLSFPLYPRFGQATAALSLFPVAAAGALFGLRAGVAAGAIVAVLDAAQMLWLGLLGLDTAVQVIPGVIAFGGIGGLIGYLHDLRERVDRHADALERERAALQSELRARQEYTDVLAHELRSPLVAIRATARTTQREAAEGSLAQKLQAIADEAGSALELLNSLKDVSAIESGHLRSALRPIDLCATVREAVGALGELGRTVSLRMPDAPIVVLGDEARLQQIVRNLIGNAVKYSPPDQAVEVSAGFSADRRSAIVQVRDYGPGIPPAERGRLFQKFARLSTAGSASGTGLGLYISKGIIADHGGELWAAWPAGGGSSFSFSVPLSDRGA